MDVRYEAFCFADPLFYESPGQLDSGVTSDFDVAPILRNQNWERHEKDTWVVWCPVGSSMPAQGWKIHVSATADNADRILRGVAELCARRRTVFKHLRGPAALLARNSKYAPREGSGKFITVYPPGAAGFADLIVELGRLLAGEVGPYILSDLRWQNGPVYARYGGFVERFCHQGDGTLVPAIADPAGNLVPDERAASFRVPDWVELPEVLGPQLAARNAATVRELPYRIHEALHFSNGGGIYLAEDVHSGVSVVLKEARPFAGLDRDGTDAVTRLRHEEQMLARLKGIEQVPLALGMFPVWEHLFLAEEHIPGVTLAQHMVRHHPLIKAAVTEDEVESYTAWAIDVLDRLGQALDAVHAAGVVFADLHPHNIIIRPTGEIALVDFELAFPVQEPRRPALGAPGYTAPPDRAGVDIDWFGLGCISLAVFLPVTALMLLDSDIPERLIKAVTKRFPVPPDYAERTKALLGPTGPRVGRMARATGGRQFAQHLDQTDADWPTIRASLAQAIQASATPDRLDRLFPGDIDQFTHGGLGVAYGAAGVLYALNACGARRVDLEQWLLRSAATLREPRPGFFDGTTGIGYVLDVLGYSAAADHMLELTARAPWQGRSDDLFSGLAGISLGLLDIGSRRADPALLDLAGQAVDELANRWRERGTSSYRRSGLMHGASGPALAFLHFFEHTGDPEFLDLAHQALTADLAACRKMDDGSLQVDDAGRRVLPYLATGSAGIGFVLLEFLRHRDDDDFRNATAAIARAAQPEFVVQSGLFNGRAGLWLYLHRYDPTTERPAVRRHLRAQSWHALGLDGHLTFPGDQLLRLSMDLATGNAGILLAIAAVTGVEASVPLLTSPIHSGRRHKPEPERR